METSKTHTFFKKEALFSQMPKSSVITLLKVLNMGNSYLLPEQQAEKFSFKKEKISQKLVRDIVIQTYIFIYTYR